MGFHKRQRVALVMTMALVGLLITLPGCSRAPSEEGAAESNVASVQPEMNVSMEESAPATPSTDNKPLPGGYQAVPFEAPDEPLPADRQSGFGPQMTFAKSRHEFGQIWNITDHKTSFPFRNTGTETLLIHEIKPSCGCTAFELDKYIYEPGEGGWIRVAFSPKGSGKQIKKIDVITNAKNGEIQTLYISSEIMPLVTIEPSMYLRFGAVDINEDHVRYVDVVGRYPDMIIDSVDAPNTLISGKVVEEDGVTDVFLPTSPKKRQRIAVTLYKNGRWGGMTTSVVVKTRMRHPETGEQIHHNVSVHVSASMFGKIHASDTMFRVGATPLKTPFKRSVTLTRSDGLPFTMSGAYLENAVMPGLSLSVEPLNQPGISGYRLTISGDPGLYEGRVGGTVLILTDVPGEEQFRIPINGIVRKIN
ncbi:MAG: DUF1573 domain-containing protein [Planctomycetota bacterium]|nr:DUF1573 domain-containing protein [Planctomycetota bacterium]